MRFKTLPSFTVIKKEEKEGKLKRFILGHLARAELAAQGQINEHSYLLIARSFHSPVVRALTSAIAEAANRAVRIKAVVLLSGHDTGSGWPIELAPNAELRILSDMRLLECHEQLWLDGATAWIGDCMRREPDKRDAYECYADGCTETARSVELSFRRLWGKVSATPVVTDEPGNVAADAIDPHLASIAAGDNPPPTASTRH